MDYDKNRDRHYKQTDEKIKLHSIVFRALLNLFLLTVVGTVTVFASTTQTNRSALIILGMFATLVLFVGCVAYFVLINREIKRY